MISSIEPVCLVSATSPLPAPRHGNPAPQNECCLHRNPWFEARVPRHRSRRRRGPASTCAHAIRPLDRDNQIDSPVGTGYDVLDVFL
jgi:hypothetical protein